jgi:hypothetical protein
MLPSIVRQIVVCEGGRCSCSVLASTQQNWTSRINFIHDLNNYEMREWSISETGFTKDLLHLNRARKY